MHENVDEYRTENMKRTFYVVVVAVISMLLSTTGCTERKAEPADTIVDSTATDSIEADTLETLLEETPMPKAADELFDDFIFNFAANRKLQMSRIDFPVAAYEMGTKTAIPRDKWHMERFFMRQGYNTLVGCSMHDIDRSKDTSVSHVTIEKVMVETERVRQYIFNRVQGLWKLQELRTVPMSENSFGDFYSFYHKFATDSTFRQHSLAETVEFSGPDPDDDFSRMEGSIMPEQWEMFAPELPETIHYNIIYGTNRTEGNRRVLVIRGIANGFEVQLTFHKSGNTYTLVKLNT